MSLTCIKYSEMYNNTPKEANNSNFSTNGVRLE